MTCLVLRDGDYRLVLQPERGGSVARFDWRDEPLFRPTCGPSILDTACFPLVPFSNRIAFGRFEAGGRAVALKPNFPGSHHPHALHGFGWLLPWQVIEASGCSAMLRHTDHPAEWPWPYVAEQRLDLTAAGLRHAISVTNHGATAMPAGLGLHPYLPRSEQTRLVARHKGEWATAADGLPTALDLRDDAVDWWAGRPVASRHVDTVYVGREGPLVVIWPERKLALTMSPSREAAFTVVYTPPGQEYFCVEPVSQATDAVNRLDQGNGLRWLEPGETLRVDVSYAAARL